MEECLALLHILFKGKRIYYTRLINPHNLQNFIYHICHLNTFILITIISILICIASPSTFCSSKMLMSCSGTSKFGNFLHSEVLNLLPIYFPHILSISGKPCLFHGSVLDSSISVCAPQGQKEVVELSTCPCHLKYSV